MDSSKLALKIYIDESTPIAAEAFVAVFHAWIQQHAITDHLLIDVADYSHVPDGPGTVLIAHEANYSIDQFDGRLGLTYSRKQPLPGSFADRLRAVIRATQAAADLLAQSPPLGGNVKFRKDEFLLKINDRLHAPNTAEMFDALSPEIESVMQALIGVASVESVRNVDPKHVFSVSVCPKALPRHTGE